jgi:Holliday junction resolvase RusA-like endonuclease
MEKDIIIINLPLQARSKKNSQQIVYNKYTHKPMIIQSKLYKNFERECGLFLKRYKNNIITYPINLKCLFFVNDKRKRDLTNLENAIADILVKYEILEDDNYNIIAGWDGSRIIYRKDKDPEIIIEISKMEV